MNADVKAIIDDYEREKNRPFSILFNITLDVPDFDKIVKELREQERRIQELEASIPLRRTARTK